MNITREEVQQVLDALLPYKSTVLRWVTKQDAAISLLQSKLAEKDDGEPVAFLLTDRSINSIVCNTVGSLIERAKHAHMADVKLRINGKDEWYEADWIKYMEKGSPHPAPKPMPYLVNGTRFKTISTDAGCMLTGLPAELSGRWVALVAAENDCHLREL